MASSFWEGDFYFNSVHSSRYRLCIIDFNEDNILKQIGSTYEAKLVEESTIEHKKWYNEENPTSSEEITLQLGRTDNRKWTSKDLIEVNKWLFTKDFCRFQTNDFATTALNIVYYMKAVSYKKFFTPDMYGYLEVTFQLFEPYAYIIPTIPYIFSSGTKNLYSNSNLTRLYKPILKVTNHGSNSEVITIRNESTQSEGLKITNIPSNSTYIIDCQMGTVTDSSGDNKFSSLMNYNFLGLQPGDNSITVQGNATVEFVCEFPVIL